MGRRYEKTIHIKECTDLTVYYNVSLGIAESCELRELEIAKDDNVLVLFVKLKSQNGTITFCEWPIGKFVDPNAEKKRTQPNVRLFLKDPPRRITLIPKGKPPK